MARNRVIYQSEALFVSPVSTGANFQCTALLSGMGPTGDSKVASQNAPSGLFKGAFHTGNPIGYLGFTNPIGLGQDPFVLKSMDTPAERFLHEDIINLSGVAVTAASGEFEVFTGQRFDTPSFAIDYTKINENPITVSALQQNGPGGISLYTDAAAWNAGLEKYYEVDPATNLPFIADKNTVPVGLLLQPFYGDYENLVQQIHRVQSANYSFTINRTDVNVFGQLARIDSISLEPPTVNLDFTYYPTDGFNERNLGLYVQSPSDNVGLMGGTDVVNAAKDLMKTDKAGQNYYILTTPENSDAFNTASANGDRSVIGLGNGYLTDYTFEASVGSIPSVSATVELYNAKSDNGTININTPAVNLTDGTPVENTKFTIAHPESDRGDNRGMVPSTGSFPESQITALRPGDIKLEIPNELGMFSTIEGEDGFNIQSFSISLPLSRTPIERIGSRYAFSRAVDVPVTVSMSVNALIGELGTGNLAKLIDDCNEYNVRVKIKAQALCGTPYTSENRTDAMIFDFKGARLDSESISSDIGSNKSVDLSWSAQLGGLEDLDHGVFISGLNNTRIPEPSPIPGRQNLKEYISRPDDAILGDE